MIPFGHDGGDPSLPDAQELTRLTHPNGSFVTLRWREMDWNFQFLAK
jgi:hypothetical protein